MGMTVVATFMNLTEAQVAAGALESGGLHPLVMDQGWGSVVWIEQAALQGFRLAVPTEEVSDAVAFFRALPKALPQPAPPRRSAVALVRSNWWRPAAALAGLGLAPVFGWLFVGFRPKRFRRHNSAPATIVVAVAAAAMIAIVLIVTGIDLLSHVPPALLVLSPLVVAIFIVAYADGRKSPPDA
jgi:hypothetical protein